jgi:hypothetical protein
MKLCQISEFLDHIFIFLFFFKKGLQIQLQNKLPEILYFWKIIMDKMFNYFWIA